MSKLNSFVLNFNSIVWDNYKSVSKPNNFVSTFIDIDLITKLKSSQSIFDIPMIHGRDKPAYFKIAARIICA